MFKICVIFNYYYMQKYSDTIFLLDGSYSDT
jgi:hypothetical protein